MNYYPWLCTVCVCVCTHVRIPCEHVEVRGQPSGVGWCGFPALASDHQAGIKHPYWLNHLASRSLLKCVSFSSLTRTPRGFFGIGSYLEALVLTKSLVSNLSPYLCLTSAGITGMSSRPSFLLNYSCSLLLIRL